MSRRYLTRCISLIVPSVCTVTISTCLATSSQTFTACVPKARIGRYSNNLYPSTTALWNSLLVFSFPPTHNLPHFKRNVNRYLILSLQIFPFSPLKPSPWVALCWAIFHNNIFLKLILRHCFWISVFRAALYQLLKCIIFNKLSVSGIFQTEVESQSDTELYVCSAKNSNLLFFLYSLLIKGSVIYNCTVLDAWIK